MTVPDLSPALKLMPAFAFPEMMLRDAAEVPPIRVLVTLLKVRIPSLALPRLRVPVTSVPMKLPWIVFAFDAAPAETRLIPARALPEMRLQTPVHAPPGVVPVV